MFRKDYKGLTPDVQIRILLAFQGGSAISSTVNVAFGDADGVCTPVCGSLIQDCRMIFAVSVLNYYFSCGAFLGRRGALEPRQSRGAAGLRNVLGPRGGHRGDRPVAMRQRPDRDLQCSLFDRV